MFYCLSNVRCSKVVHRHLLHLLLHLLAEDDIFSQISNLSLQLNLIKFSSRLVIFKTLASWAFGHGSPILLEHVSCASNDKFIAPHLMMKMCLWMLQKQAIMILFYSGSHLSSVMQSLETGTLWVPMPLMQPMPTSSTTSLIIPGTISIWNIFLKYDYRIYSR